MADPTAHECIPDDVPPLSLEEFSYEQLEKGERIGTGGDADVYKAVVEQGGNTYQVAVKEPRFEGTVQQSVMEQFEAEAETWSSLDEHKNIVSVYSWEAEPLPWLGLEYMEAGTLQEKIGQISIAEALWLSGRIAEGIRYGHRHGIAHLDIKPSNVLLSETPDGKWEYPKVSDWGLAKMILEHSTSIEGISPTYGAPEQFASEEFGSTDDITDIYQLGAVVYALLTGRPPFTGSSRAVMQSILNETPEPPSAVNPALPEVVDRVVLKALRKHKDDRYEGILPFRKRLDKLFERITDSELASQSTGAAQDGATDQASGAASEQHESGQPSQESGASSEPSAESSDESGGLLTTRRAAVGILGLGSVGVVGAGVLVNTAGLMQSQAQQTGGRQLRERPKGPLMLLNQPFFSQRSVCKKYQVYEFQYRS